ncbi:hypothetical protein CFP65_2547 [Kitasatospora sp. MMS16-BH015]|uniref:hypothetical protein n=1 Tax=Kitasatospora sp. MMS16-BH015 TaxID=2018025 RepID=UPI000CA0AA30|nr:hypothetical protein [Kitasatospora sp. MMS16-BH015]AUG77376.1 hypothetical protein CFP65_2547 [Kitasatospora sp. MMS16-BH015]
MSLISADHLTAAGAATTTAPAATPVKPAPAQPAVTKPAVTKSAVSKPTVSKPTAQPSAARSAAKPGGAAPGSAKPAAPGASGTKTISTTGGAARCDTTPPAALRAVSGPHRTRFAEPSQARPAQPGSAERPGSGAPSATVPPRLTPSVPAPRWPSVLPLPPEEEAEPAAEEFSPAVQGRPSAGLGVQYDSSGSVVVGGPRTWRFSGEAGTRLGEILLGQREAEAAEAELLHTLGLWETADPELAAAQRTAFVDTDVTAGALRFCGRWAPTTRRHGSGAESLAAWRQLRPVVVGDSPLARALVRELALGWPATEEGAEQLLVLVDGAAPPVADRSEGLEAENGAAGRAAGRAVGARLPVLSWGGTVSIGPWTPEGELECVVCHADRRGRSACVAGAPGLASSTVDMDLLAALVVAELVHTGAGIGRGARPGLIVEHTPAAGRTKAYSCHHAD